MTTETAITTVSKIPNLYVDLAERAQLQFYLAEYTVNGNFLGMKPLNNELNICGGSVAWKNTGHNVNITCHENVAFLADNATETIFYELCKWLFLANHAVLLQDDETFFPVPVRILNFQLGGIFVNKLDRTILSNTGSDVTNLFIEYTSNQLMRRFFLYDTVSGRDNGEFKIVRVATQLQLIITKTIGVDGQIYSPILDILYVERSVADLKASDPEGAYSTPLFSFAVIYQMNQSGFWDLLLIIFCIMCLGAGLFALIESRQYSNRNLTPSENLGFKVRRFAMTPSLSCTLSLS